MPFQEERELIPQKTAAACDERYSKLMTATSLLKEPYRAQWHGIIYEQLEKLDILLVDAVKHCGPGILMPEVRRPGNKS